MSQGGCQDWLRLEKKEAPRAGLYAHFPSIMPISTLILDPLMGREAPSAQPSHSALPSSGVRRRPKRTATDRVEGTVVKTEKI
jgi:hypothetical protein